MSKTPICLFVYNRPKETEAVLESLASCRGAAEHPLFIFADGAKNEQAAENVAEVRKIIHRAMPFPLVEYREAKRNCGLAPSVISGVSEVLQNHGQVIVLEDDLLLSLDFLEYMEAALSFYREDQRIWSISGYSPDIALPEGYAYDLYLTPRASSWGWATWRDRWIGIDWDVVDYPQFRKDRKLRRLFDLGGDDMSRLLDLQQRGRINSWAIRWCYAQFLRRMYTVYPVRSKVVNQGFGNNASHAGWNDARHRVSLDDAPLAMHAELQPDSGVMEAFRRHQDLGLVSKIGYFMRLHGLGYKTAQKLLKGIINR